MKIEMMADYGMAFFFSMLAIVMVVEKCFKKRRNPLDESFDRESKK